MNKDIYIALGILVCALSTWATRALPFLLFGGKRELPAFVRYLGQVLPSAIMVILVCYCLRGISFAEPKAFAPELIASVVVAILQLRKKNTFLSIAAGTACYMILIRTLFA